MDSFFISNLVIFARLLHSVGVTVSPEQVSDLARILNVVGVSQREDVYHAARALFVRRQADLALFDRAFDLFFRIQGQPPQSIIAPTDAPVRRAHRPRTIQQMMEREIKQNKPGNQESDDPESEQVMTYSPLEILRRKNFDQFTDEEIRAARQAIDAMDWKIGERKTRRKHSSMRGAQIDWAHLIRRNLKYGAELFRLPARQPKFKPRPLVVLADISGSMERYTRLVLHLLHAMSHAELATSVEVFVFGTRLTRITADLKRCNVDDAIGRVTQRVVDWSGGTRIGEAIKEYNFKWARRVLRSGAIVLVISDGWDCGDLGLLRDEMARLQKNCFRLMWLSPLVNSEQVLTQGLQVALPFVDDFLPINNLTRLEQVVAQLETLGKTSPLRRQHPIVNVPQPAEESMPRFMELPQMGTTNYVRRTMTFDPGN